MRSFAAEYLRRPPSLDVDMLSMGLSHSLAPRTLGHVKHVTIAEKSLLIGDDVADLLVRYASLLGKVGSADHVVIRSIGIDGEEVEADFLLNSGTVMMTESTHSALPEPDNSDALTYIRDRLEHYEDYTLPDPEPHTADQ